MQRILSFALLSSVLIGCRESVKTEKVGDQQAKAVTGTVYVVTSGQETIRLPMVEIKAYPDEMISTNIPLWKEAATSKVKSLNDTELTNTRKALVNAKRAVETEWKTLMDRMTETTKNPNLEVTGFILEVRAKAGADPSKEDVDEFRKDVQDRLQFAKERYERQLKFYEAQKENYVALSNTYSLSRQEAMAWPQSLMQEFFDNLPTPIATTKTDVDGKYVLTCPAGNSSLALVAHAMRTTAVREEHYYWLVTNIIEKATGKLDLNNENLVTGRQSSVGIPELGLNYHEFPKESELKINQ